MHQSNNPAKFASISSVVQEKMLRYNNNNRHKVMITAHIVITMSKEMIPLYIYDICLIEAQCLHIMKILFLNIIMCEVKLSLLFIIYEIHCTYS